MGPAYRQSIKRLGVTQISCGRADILEPQEDADRLHVSGSIEYVDRTRSSQGFRPIEAFVKPNLFGPGLDEAAELTGRDRLRPFTNSSREEVIARPFSRLVNPPFQQALGLL